MEFIKQRVGNIYFDQYGISDFRVIVDNKVVRATANAAEAKIVFLGEVERKLDKALSAELRKQGINPMTGGKLNDT